MASFTQHCVSEINLCCCMQLFILIAVTFHLYEYTTSYPFCIGGHLDCLQLGLSHFILVCILLRTFLLDIYLEMDCLAQMLYKC